MKREEWDADERGWMQIIGRVFWGSVCFCIGQNRFRVSFREGFATRNPLYARTIYSRPRDSSQSLGMTDRHGGHQ